MKWKRIAAIALSVTLVMSGITLNAPVSSAESDTLVANGGFEETKTGEDGKTGLVGWIAKPINQNNGSVKQRKKGGHNKACAVIKTDATYGMDTSSESLIEVTPNGVYDFSYWIKMTGEKSTLTPYIYYYNTEGGAAVVPYSRINAGAEGKTKWKKVKAEITIPDGVEKIGFSFVLSANTYDGSDATARIDDVKLEATEKTKSVLNASNVTKTLTAYDALQMQTVRMMQRSAAATLLSCGFEEEDVAFSLQNAAEITTEDKASGSKSLKTQNSGYVMSPMLAVQEGKTYTVTAKLKADTDSQAVFWNQQYDAAGNEVAGAAWQIGYIHYMGQTTDGWKEISFEFTVASGASQYRLDLQHNAGTGVVYWDDILIAEKVEGGEPTPANGLDTGFEEGDVTYNLNEKAVITTEEKASGSRSLRTESGAYVQSPAVPIEAGKTYIVKAKLQAGADSQAVFWSQQLDAAGNEVAGAAWQIGYIHYMGQTTDGWKEISFEVTTAEGASKFRLDLQHNDSAGVVYWDDISISEKTSIPIEPEETDKEGNMLANGTFGKDLQSWTIVDADENSTHQIVDSGSEKHGKVLETKLAADSGQVYGWSEEVTVKPNYVYTISYDVKMTGQAADVTLPYGAISLIQAFDADYASLGGMAMDEYALNTTAGKWKTVTYEYITSAKTDKIRIDLMYANMAGTVYWDSVSIVEKGEAPKEEVLNKKYDHGGTSAAVSDNNVLSNGTFDGGETPGWIPATGVKGYATENGGGVLKFQAQAGRYFQTVGMILQGESVYELKYYVKVEDAVNLDFISYVFSQDQNGELIEWKDFITYNVTENTGGKWKEIRISFTTPKLTEGTVYYLGFKSVHPQTCAWQKDNTKCDCGSKATIYLDDVSLVRTGKFQDVGEGKTSADSVIYNGTFNRYAADPYSVDGWDLNKANKNHRTTIQSTVARSGNAIRIEATGHSYIWAQDFTVEPGKIYILSYWVKVDKASGLKFAPYMNDANYQGSWWLDDAVQPVYETTDGWVKMTGAVSIPETVGNNANNPKKMVQLGFQVYEGSGLLYLDDVSMIVTNVDANNLNLDFELDSEVLYNWTFASYDGGNGSAKTSSDVRPGSAGKVSALVTNKGAKGQSLFAAGKIPVTPNTTYEFTYWTKQSGDYQGFTSQFFQQLKADGVTEDMGQTWDGNLQQLVPSASISKYWTYQVQGEVDWRQVSMCITTGSDTHYIVPRFLILGENMQVYFDDVTFTKAADGPNLDFETTSSITGAPQNWYMSMARSQIVEFNSDSSVYHSGGKSLHVKKNSLLEKELIDSASYLKLEKDNVYEFSFWVNSRNCSPDATLRMDLHLYRADGTRIYQTDGNYQLLYGTVTGLNGGEELSGWKKVTTRSAPPAEAAYATISFVLTRGYAELWIDDIFCNVVENDTDCVVYYEDFHAVDEAGNISDWDLEKVSGEASFTKNSEGGSVSIQSGEAYMKNSMKMLMTDYTYTIKGNYSSDTDAAAELRFYNYMGKEYPDERVEIPLKAGGSTFEKTVTVPSNSYTSLYIGGKNAGTISVKNVTIYMMAKPANSSDWDGSWVWYPENPVDDAVEQYRYFRYKFTLDDDPESAPFQLTVDDKYALYVNGELVDENWEAGNDSWANVGSYDLTKYVHKGQNIIALKCYNLVSEAGVLFDGKFTLNNQSVVIVASGTDIVSSKTANDETLDWTKLEYNDSGWTAVREYGQPPCSPWGPVYYNSSLYIHNAAEVVDTEVPESVRSGKTLDFTLTLKLEKPIESKFSPLVTIYKRNSLTSITSTPMVLKNHENPMEWPVGKKFKVKCSITIPDYVESGKYQLQMDSNILLLSGKNVNDNKFLSFRVQAGSTGRDPIESSVEVVNGTPTLMINGEPQAAHFYNRPDLNVYLQTDAETRLYKSDLELYITYGGSLYKGGCDPIWLEDGSIDYDVFDSVIYDTLGSNSNALAMVNFGMFAPPWWLEENPDHVITSHDGTKYIKSDDASFASEKFREEAGEVLRQLIQHMKEQSYYNRIYGIKITGGHTYEWMTWGTGDGYAPDYSKISQEGFRKYLKNKYGTVDALREAWGNSSVTFENASAPKWTEKTASSNVYVGSVEGQNYPRNMIDWNLFLNDASADTFLYYCQIAKEETDNKLIVGGYNGYLWTNNSYDAQGKAHTAFQRVLQSEYVDWVASPIAYNERLLGESNTYMTLTDAVQEYGKMYIAEEDNRTCLSNVYAGASWDASWDFQVGQTRTLADTILQAKRDFANAMINGNGLWQYDMYGGWLDDDQIYEYLSDAKAEYDFSVYVDRDTRNEVAVFVGDETYAYMTAGTMTGYSLFEPMLMEQRKHLGVMGAGYDTYNMSALLDGKVSPHKLNIILSPFEITDEMQRAINKYLKVNDQYVVWVYLPGISDGESYSLANVEKATGFQIGVEEKTAGLQVKIADVDHPLTEGIQGDIYGGSQPNLTSPFAYLKNTSGATVLGYLMDGGAAGLAVKDMGDWTSVYSAAPCLDVGLLRNLLKVSGCHIYDENEDDVIYNNNHYVAVHSDTAGVRTITLPENHSIYDVFEQKFISMDDNKITYEHGANDTHIFRLLTPNHYAVTARLKSGKGTLSAPGLTEVEMGGSYSLKVTPKKGYEIAEVLVNGEPVELKDGTFKVKEVNENYVIEVKFNMLPEMVEVVQTVQELVILPWWAFILIVALVSAGAWQLNKVVKKKRREKELEEGGRF